MNVMWHRLKFNNWGLTFKFLFVFLVMITLPTIYFGSFIYIKMNEAFKMQATESTEGILDKIEMSLTSVIQDVENISAYAIFNEDFRTYMTTPKEQFNERFYTQTTENIKGYLTFQLLSAAHINSFSVKGNNGNFIEIGEPVSGDETKWDKLAIRAEGNSVWSDAYNLSSGWNGEGKNLQIVSLSRVINDYNNINQPIGFIRIRLDLQKLNKIIELSNLKNEGKVYIKNAENNIILATNNSEETDWEKSVINNLNSDTLTASYMNNGQEYLFVRRNLKSVNWDLIAVVNQNEVTEKLVNIKNLVRDMIIVLTLLGLLTFVGYYFTHIRRIITLTKTTEKIGKQDFNVNVKATSMDEIGQLGSRFNQMVFTIKNLIDKEYKLEIKQKESELKALQNQIDPHFLYNTLDMIRWKARMEEAPETSRLIEMLSRIFRNTLKNDKLLITLKEELLFISSYLEFQSKRMNGKLTYTIDTELDTENYFIIKQTIQPLIENSIKHGFYNRQGEMDIKVICYTKDDLLCIDAIDNGQGMSEERFLETLSGDENHGLKNIQERIQLAFGGDFGLSMIEMEQSGTLIRIKTPILNSYSDINLHGLGGKEND